jgi:hypothetical protein
MIGIELNQRPAEDDIVLDVDNLTVAFPTEDGLVRAVTVWSGPSGA